MTIDSSPPGTDALSRLLIDNVHDYAIFAIDAEGLVQSWSTPAERLLGYNEHEVLGRSADRFYSPEDVAAGIPAAELREAMSKGRVEHDRWHVRKDGSRFWSGGVTSPLPGGGDAPRMFAKIMRDQTGLRQAEEAHRKALAYARSIVDTVREPLVVLDGGLRLHTANPAFYRTFRVSASDTEGRFLYDLGNGQWNIPRLRTLLEEVLPDRTSIEAFEVVHDFPQVGRKVMLLNARRLQQEAAGAELILLAIEDVTERRRLEAERHELESRFTSLVKNLKDHCIFTLDPQGVVTTWNMAAENVLGYTEAEVVGRHFSFIFTEDDRRQGLDDWELGTAQEQGRAEDERWHLRKGGEQFWAFGILSAVREPDGRLTGFAKILRDITQRKRDEEALRESEQRYRLLFENLNEGFALAEMIWDDRGDPVDWRYLEVNPGWEQTGVPVDDTIGRTAREVNPSIEPYWIETYGRVVKTGEPAHYENFAVGFGKWYETFAFRHSENCFAVLFRDVTDRIQAVESLRASEARLQKVISTTTVGVLFFDIDGSIRDGNNTAERLFGYSVDELRKLTHWQTLTAPEYWDATARTAAELASSGHPAPYEKQMIRKDGTRWWGLFAPIRVSGTGPTSECMEFIIDITDRRKAEEALQESAKRKDEFIAMLSHELRNPLAPLSNSVQLLRTLDTQDAMLLRVRDMIDRQVAHIGRLVDDLLDASRISRGKVHVSKEALDLSAVIRQAVEISGPLIDARRHHLIVTLPKESLPVQGDAVRLTQVVCNLLNNAAKYTEEGGHVSVAAERESTEGRDQAVIRVTDNGRGIDPAALPRVFELFYQADRNLDRTEGGLGIGLSLAHSIVEMHGGSIAASSAGHQKGSEFIVRLPLAASAAQIEPPNAPLGSRPTLGLRLLVVDDNRDAADSLVTLLSAQGHDVSVAYDGFEACAKALDERPQVVLLDIGLPGRNGYEVCQLIRKGGLHDTVIVALTGYGQAEDRRRSEEAGFDAHLIKPVDFDVLGALLKTVGRAGPPSQRDRP